MKRSKEYLNAHRNYFIRPHKKGWQVKRGYRKYGRVFPTRESAIEYGLYRAERSHAFLVAYYQDGKTFDTFSGKGILRRCVVS